MKLIHQILLFSSARAVTLKTDSYSSEMALAQLGQEQFTPCLCWRYALDASVPPAADNVIENGGYLVDVGILGANPGTDVCEITTTADAAAIPVAVLVGQFQKEITNQSCLYKIWMCACWASQTDGCLCGRQNSSGTITAIRPTMGKCEDGSGPLLNPKAQDGGGLALKCAPNPCLACCACSKGLCLGNGDPKDDDYQGANCCDCCGSRGGYTCGLGGDCGGGGQGCGGYGGGGSGGGGCSSGGGSGGGGYGGGGGGYGGPCIRQNVNQ
jgi:hypothetical protein